MALLKFTAIRFPEQIAVTDENQSATYEEIYIHSQNLANNLQIKFSLKAKMKVAFLCRNNIAFVKALCAVSRIGCWIYLLNPEMTDEQFSVLNQKHRFDFLFCDDEALKIVESENETYKTLKTSELENFCNDAAAGKIKRAFSSEIIVLTGGTTGVPKTARRKASVSAFLFPFFELLTKLHLDRHQTFYVATPAYHGFGISAIIIGIVLAKKMFLLPRFNTAKSCELIKQHQIEAVTLVPLMLQRMLDYDAQKIASLKCIISGGAALNPTLAEETLKKTGDTLFNLYGTSEAGFSVIAAPSDLHFSSETIGKKIAGVKLKILDNENKPVAPGTVGKICIKSAWSVKSKDSWIETGDLGFQDRKGYLYLRGRSDEMIVSGGENVYPIELENILSKHPSIRQTAVIGIPDKDFGQRLKAFIVLNHESKVSETEIKQWLSSRAARFQMPAAIEFLNELPTTSIGKISKKMLPK